MSRQEGYILAALPQCFIAHPTLAVAILTMREDPEYARQALRAGARSYVLKEAEPTELLQAFCHGRVGTAQLEMCRYEAAIDALSQALELLYQMPGGERTQAFYYTRIGTALSRLGRDVEAMQKHALALTLYQQGQGTEREQAWSRAVVLAVVDRHGAARLRVDQVGPGPEQPCPRG